MGFIEDMALRAGDYITGIPWSGITPDPYQDVYTKLQYIVPLQEAMREVMSFADQIDWTWDVYDQPGGQDATAAWYGVREGILTKNSAIAGAVSAGASQLSGTAAPTLDREIWRAFVSSIFSTAMHGYAAHKNLVWQYAGVDPSVIVKNADYVHAMCQALVVMWQSGVLNSLKKGAQPLQGVGAVVATSTVVIVAIASVVVIYLACWFIQTLAVLLKQMQLVDEACAQALADPSNKAKQKACQGAQKLLNQAKPNDPSSAYNIIATFAGIGVLVYVGSLVLPGLVQRIQASRT
jgi:hypothetical protein